MGFPTPKGKRVNRNQSNHNAALSMMLNLFPASLTATSTGAVAWCGRATSQAQHPSYQKVRGPIADDTVGPCTASSIDDRRFRLLSSKDILGCWLQGVQHRVVKSPSSGSTYHARTCRCNGSLFNAGKILRAVEGSLLCGPCKHLGSCDMTLCVSVLRTKVDVSEFQLHNIDVAMLQET